MKLNTPTFAAQAMMPKQATPAPLPPRAPLLMKRLTSLMLTLGLSLSSLSAGLPKNGLYDKELALHDMILDRDLEAMRGYFQRASLTQQEYTHLLHLVTSGFIFCKPRCSEREWDIIRDSDFLDSVTALLLEQSDYTEEALVAACCNCLNSHTGSRLKAMLASDKVTPSVLNARIRYVENHPTLLGIAFLHRREEAARMLAEHGASLPKEDWENIRAYQLTWKNLLPAQKKVWKELLGL